MGIQSFVSAVKEYCRRGQFENKAVRYVDYRPDITRHDHRLTISGGDPYREDPEDRGRFNDQTLGDPAD